MNEIILHSQMANVAQKIQKVHDRFEELESINEQAKLAVHGLAEANAVIQAMQKDLGWAIQSWKNTGEFFLSELAHAHSAGLDILKLVKKLAWAMGGLVFVNLVFLCALFLKHSR
jgi:hypothetical protein